MGGGLGEKIGESEPFLMKRPDPGCANTAGGSRAKLKYDSPTVFCFFLPKGKAFSGQHDENTKQRARNLDPLIVVPSPMGPGEEKNSGAL